MNTYVANQAAFLTAKILRGQIASIAELRASNKPIVTVDTYVDRLLINYDISAKAPEGAPCVAIATIPSRNSERVVSPSRCRRACMLSTRTELQQREVIAGRDYAAMISGMKAGRYAAVISDATQVVPRADADPSCSLHVLDEPLGKFDLSLAFRTGFSRDHPGLIDDVSSALLHLGEAECLKVRCCGLSF